MTTADWKNQLYFGDNLNILRDHVDDASVDLIYLDPPFNSNASYNVLFQEKSGQQSAAQITAFEDTWHWNLESESAYRDVVTNASGKLPDLLQAMRSFLGENDMMAYLTMMAQRMVELHRVLKDTGSIYLHCDPTASHYLKLLLDAVFGARNYRNEISWRRTNAHNDAKQGRRQFGNVRDTILFYSKGNRWIWNWQYTEYDSEYVDNFYKFTEPGSGRLFQMGDLTAAKPGGDTSYEWRVKRPKDGYWEADLTDEYLTPVDNWEYKGALPYRGRYWAYSKAGLIAMSEEGRLAYTKGGVPRYKRYLDEMPGVPLQNDWTDIRPTSRSESLDYATQKPEALLERIVSASSNEGDVVLDPFCGCGTAIAAAERLNRRWIGIDITHIAITLIRHRLHDTFKADLKPYEVLGQPQDVASAQALAVDSENSGRYQFEWWALGLVDARPAQDRRKGADSGIDGYINFFDDNSGKAKRIVVQVKSGHVTRNQVATLKGDMEREKAEIGLFITLRPPTRPMEAEAASAGLYTPEHFPDSHYPRIQILTIEELLAGTRTAQYPRFAPEATFRRAPRRRRSAGTQSAFA